MYTETVKDEVSDFLWNRSILLNTSMEFYEEFFQFGGEIAL